MINDVLAWFPGPIELFIIFMVLVIPVVLIYYFFKLVLRNKNENVRLRLEVGKLADELEQIRKQKKFEEESDNLDQSD